MVPFLKGGSVGTFVQTLGTNASKASGTTIGATIFGTTAGNLIVAFIAFDNLNGSTPTVSSLTRESGETATWVKLGAHSSAAATAGSGLLGELWAIKTTVAWGNGFTVTATLDGTVGSKAIGLAEFQDFTTTLRGTAASVAGTSANALSLNTSGTAPVAGDLVLGLMTNETSAAPGADLDTLNGSWADAAAISTTGGSAATNAGLRGQYKIVTAGGHQTLDPSSATGDGGLVVVALVPVDTGTLVSDSDIGAGTDGTATLTATLTPATDARTAVDAGTLAVTQPIRADTSTMVDAATLSTITAKAGADTALTMDAGTLLASFSGTEAGTSADAPSGPLSATLAGADTGAMGTEGYALTVVLQSVETGSGTDAGSLDAGATQKAGSDTATGTDAATLATSQTRADTGSTSDVATLVVTITGSDLRSVVDTVQALAATHQGADTGSQVEGFTLNAGGNQSSGDTSSTAESGTLAIQLTGGADGITTVDQGLVTITLLKSGSDTSTVVESAALLAQLTVAEIVAAAEVLATLIGPQKWDFISAEVRALTTGELSAEVSASTTGELSALSGASGLVAGATSISMTISF